MIAATQREFTGWQLLELALKHPSNLRVVGPDTGLFRWQIARKLRWYKEADRVRAKLTKLNLTPAYVNHIKYPHVSCYHYEVHSKLT